MTWHHCLKILFVSFFLSLASLSSAHQVGISAGYYELKGDDLFAYISVSQADLIRAHSSLDVDFDGVLSSEEVSTSSSTFSGSWKRGVRLFSDQNECETSFVSARKPDKDGVLIQLKFSCDPAKESYKLTTNFIKRFTVDHRHLIKLNLPKTLHRSSLAPRNTSIHVSVDGRLVEADSGGRFLSLLVFGLEHIVTGYDHLFFLLGLILVALNLKTLLIMVTAFTLGHSITLAIGALGLWTPNGTLVEILIAASIVYVGIENIWVKTPKHRWYLTLLFGLVHGFGFGTILRLHGLSGSQVALDLFAFNLGVELGQVLCLVFVIPVLKWCRGRGWFDSWGLLGLNAMVTLAGVYWLQERLLELWK